ncbi:hypothetical protein CANCADRAFT_15563, partial [Tortispora caseinolytica NRRL Y-17796]
DSEIHISDELSVSQNEIRTLKSAISAESKRNFFLEKDIRYLESRIGSAIQNKLTSSEKDELLSRLDDGIAFPEGSLQDRNAFELYCNLFYVLQMEPKHVAELCELISPAERDFFLELIMFTLYGNQHDKREEHLLLQMFQIVLAHQFDSCTEYSSLLRSNTPVSRMMTTYTCRGPGKNYLKAVLRDPLTKIIEDMQDESSIFNDALQPDTHEERERLIKARADATCEGVKVLSEILLSHVEQIPFGLRWICKQIRILARRRFSNASEEQISSLIGGFFFLRFINPAIVTPEAYDIFEIPPTPKGRKQLTLIAKIMQMLVNQSMSHKEEYMAVFTTFINENKPRLGKFLRDVCDVPDFNEEFTSEQFEALTRKDLEIQITINEIYETHALVAKYLDKMKSDSVHHHLRQLIESLGDPPPRRPKEENYITTLELFTVWDTYVAGINQTLPDSEDKDESHDLLFLRAKNMVVQLFRLFPTQTVTRKNPIDLIKLIDMASASTDDSIASIGSAVSTIISGMSTHEQELLATEVYDELRHLGELLRRNKEELEELKQIKKATDDRAVYLRSQREAFHLYLQSV